MTEQHHALLRAQYHQAEDYFFSAISRQHVHFSDRACAYTTGIPSQSLNALIIRPQIIGRADDDIGAELIAAIEWFDAAGQLFGVAVPDILPADESARITNTLLACGLHPVDQTTAMALILDNRRHVHNHHPFSADADDLRILRTDHHLADWSRPLESAFEGTPALTLAYRLRHQAALERNRQLVHFSLYIGQQPVSSLTLSLQQQIARLDDIGTQAEFQGRGYARLLIDHALDYAKANHAMLCCLEASAQGAQLYRKIGFEDLFGYRLYQC